MKPYRLWYFFICLYWISTGWSSSIILNFFFVRKWGQVHKFSWKLTRKQQQRAFHTQRRQINIIFRWMIIIIIEIKTKTSDFRAIIIINIQQQYHIVDFIELISFYLFLSLLPRINITYRFSISQRHQQKTQKIS